MYLCKVHGRCVATLKHKQMQGNSLVTVQRLSAAGTAEGMLMVAVDCMGCSIGEIVLVTTGSSAREAIGDAHSPVDMAITGIVDSCDSIEKI